MLLDLSKHADSPIPERADVCVIGSGVAGLLLSTRLRRSGLRVSVLETGARESRDDAHPLNEVVQLGRCYRGATNGRARGLGGTSTRWGGAMLPFLPFDMRARPFLNMPAWPVDFDAVARFIPEIEKLFSLDRGSFEGDFLESFGDAGVVPSRDPDFLLRFAKWPVFRIRNFANLFAGEIAKDANLRVWCNANVVDFNLNEAGARLVSVTAKSSSGTMMKVEADRFVICAGAIESTRLLLWLDRCANGALTREGDALGRYFHDHISIIAADFETHDATALNRIAGFRFVGPTMRSLRFELSPKAQEEERVASAFAHIQFSTRGPTTVDAIREILRAGQKGVLPPVASLRRAALGLPDLGLIGLWRYGRRQLRWPHPAEHHLHIVVEQLPSRDNAITLAKTTDAFGIPKACIDWRILPQQTETLEAYARRFAAFWARHGLAQTASLRWRDIKTAVTLDADFTDVFHPGGSTRMGKSSKCGVVDTDLKVYGLANLYVASTSVFPSGASANPTFMMMLFVCRLAEHISSRGSVLR